MNNLKTEILSINPQIAAELLQKNINNRPLSQKRIDFYSKQMTEGRWQMTGETLQFSKTDKLLNGQHRLHAIIKSGTTQDFLVVYGIDDKVFDVLDNVNPRSASDTLSVAGFHNATNLAALARAILAWERGDFLPKWSQMVFSNPEIREFCERKDLEPYLLFGAKLYDKNRFMSYRDWSLYYYLFSQKSQSEAADFLTRLATGLELTETDPIYLLRKKLEFSQFSKSQQLTPKAKVSFIVQAWNYYRRGKTVTTLRYSPDDKLPEII